MNHRSPPGTDRDRGAAAARRFVTFSFGVCLLLAYVLALQHARTIALTLGAFGALLVLSRIGIRIAAAKGKNVSIFAAAALLALLLCVPELGFRVAGFRYTSLVQFGHPRPTEYVYFDLDDDLFWTWRKSDPAVNSWGFREKEIPVPKPTGVFRILFLGDSCMEMHYPEIPRGYPGLAERILNADRPPAVDRFESISFAVSGYTSHQGRRAAEIYGLRVQPDLVVVCFGWNDHWQAYGAVDAEKVVRVPDTALAKAVEAVRRNSRLAQFLHYLGRRHKREGNPIGLPRVPLDHYRSNLERIGSLFAERNVPVLYLTAPTAQSAVGVPEYLIRNGFVSDPESCLAAHRAYNAVVRRLCRNLDPCILLDLDVRWNEMPPDEMRRLFIADGIHCTPEGLRRLAAELAAFIAAEPSFFTR